MSPGTDPQALSSGVLTNIVLVILFLSSAATDVKWNKIYNFQTYPAMTVGLVIGYAAGGYQGALLSFAGLLVGMALLFIFYLLGGMGAGDVKLLGAIGALKGSTFVLWTMFYTGLVGGAMAFAVIIWQGTFIRTLKNLFFFIRHPLRAQQGQEGQNYQFLPYGLAISIGCFWALCVL